MRFKVGDKVRVLNYNRITARESMGRPGDNIEVGAITYIIETHSCLSVHKLHRANYWWYDENWLEKVED